ncbi:MAG TPA: exosome complex RNA-binding protein Rrp4 [archaeon]|nr:exosome complex RNA-binding protein Rrp4 [archaeon]
MAETEQNTSALIKAEREFVVPGDKIVSSMEYLPGRNTFRDGDSIYSKRLGIMHLENHVISVVPLSGGYTAQVGDMVVGEIEDVQSNGWFVNMQAPQSCYLSLSGVRGFVRPGTDLTRIYNVSDLIYVKVVSVTNQGIGLSMQDDRARKLSGGKMIYVEPVKVPRVIGKQGSMISMIKRRTGSNIVVGQNGAIWLQGGDEALATTVIKMVEKESHKEGLTDMIEKFLNENAPPLPANQLPSTTEASPEAESENNLGGQIEKYGNEEN